MKEVIIKNNELVIITERKPFFYLSKKVDNKLKHDIDVITKHNEFLAEDTMKNEIGRL